MPRFSDTVTSWDQDHVFLTGRNGPLEPGFEGPVFQYPPSRRTNFHIMVGYGGNPPGKNKVRLEGSYEGNKFLPLYPIDKSLVDKNGFVKVEGHITYASIPPRVRIKVADNAKAPISAGVRGG